jgi:hypothetical protein
MAAINPISIFTWEQKSGIRRSQKVYQTKKGVSCTHRLRDCDVILKKIKCFDAKAFLGKTKSQTHSDEPLTGVIHPWI